MKIKECQYCGSSPIVCYSEGKCKIACIRCFTSGPEMGSDVLAALIWNQMTLPEKERLQKCEYCIYFTEQSRVSGRCAFVVPSWCNEGMIVGKDYGSNCVCFAAKIEERKDD